MIANKIKKGDEVRVIAPSGSLARLDDNNFKIAKERLESLGLTVTISKNAYNVDKYGTSSIDERIQDIHEAFLDKNVKMIICAIGGYSVIQILDKIDYELIKNNPKIIVGYSDNTALLNAIYTKTGLVTYLGPNFADFAVKLGFEYTFDFFKKIVLSNSDIVVEDSLEFSDDQWYINQDNRVFEKNEGRKVVNEGKAIGKIIGGNLCTLQLLQGTEFMPDLNDSILFIEDDGETGKAFIKEFDRNLQSLLHCAKGKKIKGLVIGRAENVSEMNYDKWNKIIESKSELQNIPIIINADIGHTTPIFTFPIGGNANIVAKDKNIEIKFSD